jgi:hypothetical protein
MQNDLHRTFGEIYSENIARFRKQLLEVQHLQADRKKSEKWVSNLRFLNISNVPQLLDERCRQERLHVSADRRNPFRYSDAPFCDIPITEQRYEDGETPYIAVSWKWAGPQHEPRHEWDQALPVFRYRIRRSGAALHESDFPDLYMDRVIQFAQSHGIERLWIDKECIYQRVGDAPRDRDLGVQIMDVVYGDSAKSVGLLTTALLQQYEVDMLSALLHRSIFYRPKDEEDPKIRKGVDIGAVQILILRILSDPRWSRGWIFQEDHLASERMTLLIPCDENLDKGDDYDFGKIPGELQINLAAFRKVVTMFCFACSKNKYELQWPNADILGKAKQYNIWNRKIYGTVSAGRPDHPRVNLWSDPTNTRDGGARLNNNNNYSNVSLYPTTTNSVLDDICNRSLEREEDRIALLANALKFSKRLDISKDSPLVQPGAYGLSVALLALILMNGEILMNAPWEQSDDVPTEANIMQHTLQSYLQSCQYHFNAPNLRLQQTFIDRCRFKPPTITPRGLETKGFLFSLLPRQTPEDHRTQPRLRLDARDREQLSRMVRYPRSWNKKLNNVAHKALGMLIAKLNTLWPSSRLAAYMKQHLDLDLHPPQAADASISTRYVLDMLSALYQALLDDRQLRLARLDSASADAEPTAIFIEPVPDGWKIEDPSNLATEVSTKIFTTWDSGRNAYDKERLASLEVGIFDGTDDKRERDAETCSLRSFGWVNGVWNVRGETMDTYTFLLAGVSQPPGSSGGRKRKRGDRELGLVAPSSNVRRRVR